MNQRIVKLSRTDLRWLRWVACVLMFFGSAGHAQIATGYDTLIQQGNAQLQSGNASQAETLGEQAIQADPKRWEAYALTGGALMSLKRYEDAEDRLSEAIKLAPAAKQDGLRNLRRQCVLAESGASPLPPVATQSTVSNAETVLWLTIKNSTSPADFQTYLTQYPNGAYAALAHRNLDGFAWNTIANSTNSADFQSFLDQRPASEFAPQARQRIDQLNAQAAQTQAYATAAQRNLPTWTDPSTGLMWTKADSGSTIMPSQAPGYCADTQWAGLSDWRLPTPLELRSIYDENSPSTEWSYKMGKGKYQISLGVYFIKGGIKLSQGGGATSFSVFSSDQGRDPSWRTVFAFGIQESKLLVGNNVSASPLESLVLCVRTPAK